MPVRVPAIVIFFMTQKRATWPVLCFLLSKCTKFVGILRKGVLMVTVYIASPYTLGEELAAADIPFKRSGS